MSSKSFKFFVIACVLVALGLAVFLWKTERGPFHTPHLSEKLRDCQAMTIKQFAAQLDKQNLKPHQYLAWGRTKMSRLSEEERQLVHDRLPEHLRGEWLELSASRPDICASRRGM